ncbi:DoxX family protein [Candidatus Pacearchaeota archaeon]|nr:DoxX family protein [Candidatus Pacearchaeota archaeon]
MNSKDFAFVILRVSMALVFLYFGFQQVYSPDSWTSFVPEFMVFSGMTANNLVVFNGFLELIFGLFLIIGLYVRFSALILSLHLFGIAFSLGFNPIGIRDFGIAFATLALSIFGSDKYTLDYKFENR